MSVLIANNASTILASGITSSQTTIALNAGTGSLFPSPTAPDFFYGTLISSSNPSQIEIVRVTARSVDSLTVVRGQDGTAGQAFNISDIFALLPTRATDNALRAYASAPTTTGSAAAQVATNTVPVIALLNGAVQTVVPGFTNLGPWTFAVDGLAATQVFANGAACVGGEAPAGVPVDLIFLTSNSAWNIINPPPAGRNVFVDPCCRVAQGAAASLSTSRQYGVVDLVECWATGTAVSAGTITQDTAGTMGGVTPYACEISGATITGTGKVFFRKFIESRDSQALNGKTVLFLVEGYQNTGGSINAFLTLNKFNAQDNSGAVTQLATNSGAPTSVPTATKTGILLAYTFGATDGSNGVELILEMDCGAVTTKNFEATDWQACVGTLAQSCAVPPFNDDVVKAARYFETSYGLYVAPATVTVTGRRLFAPAATTANNQVLVTYDEFRVQKLASPTVKIYSPASGTVGNIRDMTASGDKAVIVQNISVIAYEIQNSSGGSIPAGEQLEWQMTADCRL